MTRVGPIGALLAVVSFSACSEAPSGGGDEAIGSAIASVEPSDITFEVALRGTGSATIHATVYSNARAGSGTNILAVHGFTTTGFEFGSLAAAIFQDPFLGRAVRRVIAIHLPGHGDSGFPANLPDGVRFGDLNIDDNVSIVLQAIDALKDQGLAPRALIGHSVGGLDVQAAQEVLLARHSSLAAHGILSAVLLAPIPPHGQPWHTSPPRGEAPPPVNDPVLGSYFLTTPEVQIPGFFGTLAGQTIPAAPTPAQVVAARYIGPEPLAALLQLVEAPMPLPTGGTTTVLRPTVRAGAFDLRRGTLLTLVSFSQDTNVHAGDLGSLYEYLTGDRRDRFYRPVVAPDAVHAMLISNPTDLLEAIRSRL